MPQAASLLHAYFGHHKAATSWLIKILSDLAYLNGFRITTIDSASDLAAALNNGDDGIAGTFVAYRNADPASLNSLGPFVGFHVIRDPRDIAVSSYFSHLHSHPTDNWPELAQHKKRLSTLDTSEGLLCDMEFCRDLPTRGHNIAPYRCMAEWDYARPDVLEIRYEDLIVNPYDVMMRAFGFVGLLSPQELGASTLTQHLGRILIRRVLPGRRQRLPQLSSWNILATIYDNRYDKKAAGRARGDENPKSHYRKGIAGDWRNYFEDQHKARFKELYGDILIRLGYETGSDWS